MTANCLAAGKSTDPYSWLNLTDAQRIARCLDDCGYAAEAFFRASLCGYAVYELTTGTVITSWAAFVRFMEHHGDRS